MCLKWQCKYSFWSCSAAIISVYDSLHYFYDQLSAFFVLPASFLTKSALHKIKKKRSAKCRGKSRFKFKSLTVSRRKSIESCCVKYYGSHGGHQGDNAGPNIIRDVSIRGATCHVTILAVGTYRRVSPWQKCLDAVADVWCFNQYLFSRSEAE